MNLFPSFAALNQFPPNQKPQNVNDIPPLVIKPPSKLNPNSISILNPTTGVSHGPTDGQPISRKAGIPLSMSQKHQVINASASNVIHTTVTTTASTNSSSSTATIVFPNSQNSQQQAKAELPPSPDDIISNTIASKIPKINFKFFKDFLESYRKEDISPEVPKKKPSVKTFNKVAAQNKDKENKEKENKEKDSSNANNTNDNNTGSAVNSEDNNKNIIEEIPYSPPERKSYPDFDPKSVLGPRDKKLFECYFLEKKMKSEDSKITRLSRRQNVVPFQPQYDKWPKVGQGYLENPNPPDLFEDPHFVDFYCQCRLKALVIGGEGAPVASTKDDQAPLLAANARLQFSMIIDEHGIEHLKVEAKMKSASFKSPKQITIDKLAKLRNYLETKIREYNDDVRNCYRPPLQIPLEDPLKGVFYSFPFEELHFFHYTLRMIELTSDLTPKHSLHITKAFTRVIPLILKALTHPEKDCHFVGKRIHFTYFYRLFHLLNRLSEYFKAIPMIPYHASFGLAKDITRADITSVWQKELHQISDNIKYGGCLSWILLEMRDVSLAMTMHLNNVIMIDDTVKLFDKLEKSQSAYNHSNNNINDNNNNNNSNNNNNDVVRGENKDDFDTIDLLRIANREDNGQKLYKIKFCVDSNGLLSLDVKRPTDEELNEALKLYVSQTFVPPFYPFVLNQSRPEKVVEENGPTYVPVDSDFVFDFAIPTDGFGRAPRINFEPHSRQSIFLL